MAKKSAYLTDWEDGHCPARTLCQKAHAKEEWGNEATLQLHCSFHFGFTVAKGKSHPASERQDEQVRQKETWSSPSGCGRFLSVPHSQGN